MPTDDSQDPTIGTPRFPPYTSNSTIASPGDASGNGANSGEASLDGTDEQFSEMTTSGLQTADPATTASLASAGANDSTTDEAPPESETVPHADSARGGEPAGVPAGDQTDGQPGAQAEQVETPNDPPGGQSTTASGTPSRAQQDTGSPSNEAASPSVTRTRGCFKIIEIKAPARLKGDPRPCADGAFYLVPDAEANVDATPAQQATLYTQVCLTLQVLQAIYIKGQRKQKDEVQEIVTLYYGQLRQIADIGLTGAWARPGVATPMLANLQAEVLANEASSVKNSHMASLAKICAWAGGPALIVAVASRIAEPAKGISSKLAREPGLLTFTQTTSLGLLVAGASLGVWLSFSARKTALEFDDLLVLEDDLLKPKSRVALAVSLTLVLALLFQAGILTLGIGGFKTDDLFANPLTAAILGVVCGFSEQSLSQTLAAQAGRILKAPERTPAGKAAVEGTTATS